ncbi:hypothetical protein Tco_0912451 [Tanacetum coccineum]
MIEDVTRMMQAHLYRKIGYGIVKYNEGFIHTQNTLPHLLQNHLQPSDFFSYFQLISLKPNPNMAKQSGLGQGSGYCYGFTVGRPKEVVDGRCTTRFHELARLVSHMVTPESKHIDRYIRGLASAIRVTMETIPVIVQIPLSNREILKVHRERPEGKLKQLNTMKADELKLKDIPIVRNFTSVFPVDIPGLPPFYEVEFRIDLDPEATLVAKSPNHLAPTEMQELSNQLKELQDKGFIRPSSSPWGAPVLFVKKKDSLFRTCIELSGTEQADCQEPLPSSHDR